MKNLFFLFLLIQFFGIYTLRAQVDTTSSTWKFNKEHQKGLQINAARQLDSTTDYELVFNFDIVYEHYLYTTGVSSLLCDRRCILLQNLAQSGTIGKKRALEVLAVSASKWDQCRNYDFTTTYQYWAINKLVELEPDTYRSSGSFYIDCINNSRRDLIGIDSVELRNLIQGL